VNYILGDNPRGTSYMVGYGLNYPRQVHHRGASIVSIKTDPSFVNCQEGYSSWYGKQAGNPNLLEGAIVGGPDEYDDFADERNNYEQTEAATYNSAPLLGVLARLAGACGGLDEYQSAPEVAANHTLRPSHRHHPGNCYSLDCIHSIVTNGILNNVHHLVAELQQLRSTSRSRRT
jgi:hypothetical protein